jgi:hypothetical protein
MAKVSKNLRKSPLLVEYFSSWTDLTVLTGDRYLTAISAELYLTGSCQ